MKEKKIVDDYSSFGYDAAVFWMTCRKAAVLINEDVLSIIHEFMTCMAVKEALNKMNAGDMYPKDYHELLK
jgi:hypothetical protein